MKTCTKCLQEKDSSEFYPRHLKCKQCCIAKQREWSLTHSELVKGYMKKFLDTKMEQYKESKRKYHRKNRKMLCDKANRWSKNNRGKVNNRIRYRMKNDVGFRMTYRLRSRLNEALKSSGCKKHTKTLLLLGCSISDLKQYIESKFKSGMDWNNYGYRGWHIDHIIPCSQFDLSNPDEQKKCFHYTNLQPMWAKDNLVKHNKIL